MNTANIKKYAPKARNNFIAAVTKQAARYGITAKGTEPMEQRGDIALIGENAFPKAIAPARKALERMVEQMRFAQAMEQAAYSWFNRLCAIRYMEIHDFLDHGRRVLSTANGDLGTPQILDDCLDLSLPGLDPQQVAELKLDGNKDEELYRELLLAQCHALHEAMPFLFEAVDDATELLLPDNLTKTDSLIRELVSAIPEDDWQDVEIIGWLYQFYISEKKDQVIGKVVKSEDIPAATQLFTPNWIVQYLVQNSVGRQWLQTYPDSPLRDQMPYFIEPGKQSPEVQAQLDETVPDAIDPESITVLDPACGSGHILVEAYKILKAIYEERGYRSRDIPQQILKHNLFGLDIDDRAGQLAGFALMMLAREDDRRLFSRVAEGEVTLNVLSLKETGHLNLPQLWQDLNLSGDWQQGSSQSLFESEQADLSSASADERYQLLQRTLERFEEAKTFGSLIEVPEEDAAPLKALVEELEQLARRGDIMQKPAAETLLPYVSQAWVLAQRYDSVIANPPYMGKKFQNSLVKNYLETRFSGGSQDIFSAFILRSLDLIGIHGHVSLMTPMVWMFISTFSNLRRLMLERSQIDSLIQLEYNASGDVRVPLCTFTLSKGFGSSSYGTFIRLVDFPGQDIQHRKTLEALENPESCNYLYRAKSESFELIPNAPVSYWLNDEQIRIIDSSQTLSSICDARQGLSTGDTNKFLRYWWEVDFNKIGFGFESSETFARNRLKWAPYNKGGEFRKWYGNQEYVVNWERDGADLKRAKPKSVIRNENFYFSESLSWSDVTSSYTSFRFYPKGFVFDTVGHSAFFDRRDMLFSTMGYLNGILIQEIIPAINPTLHFSGGYFLNLPRLERFEKVSVSEIVEDCIRVAKEDWDFFERSWEFSSNPLIKLDGLCSLRALVDGYINLCREKVSFLKDRESALKSVLEDGYQVEGDYNVPEKQITLTVNPAYRYGAEVISESHLSRFYSDTTGELISYAIGCAMGRYSLDKDGIVYAGQNNASFNKLVNDQTFASYSVDEDGILPLTDREWFFDDATNRFREFVRVVWGDEHLQENLDFVAESLCLHAIKPKRGESAMDTIRRYLSTQFYKDHLRTYKKRPIYWLFSSGKHKAFECLVYLHRYNEGTLARMRTEYVIPLSAKLNAYAEKLEQDKEASTSAAETKRLEKEIATLHKQQVELAEFDEKLRHYADQRISLDLDDGVKVNYGKFGDLLAEVKAVTGEKPQ